MSAKRKSVLIVMTIILVCQLLGENKAAAAIKAAGKLLIPTAAGQKSCRGVLWITREKIRIECDKKVFQPFNLDVPRQQRLDINASELVWIEIDESEKKIYLKVENSFVQRYRNICNLESNFIKYTTLNGHLYSEFWAIVFVYEKPLNISYLDREVLNSINRRAYPVFIKFYFFATGPKNNQNG